MSDQGGGQPPAPVATPQPHQSPGVNTGGAYQDFAQQQQQAQLGTKYNDPNSNWSTRFANIPASAGFPQHGAIGNNWSQDPSGSWFNQNAATKAAQTQFGDNFNPNAWNSAWNYQLGGGDTAALAATAARHSADSLAQTGQHMQSNPWASQIAANGGYKPPGYDAWQASQAPPPAAAPAATPAPLYYGQMTPQQRQAWDQQHSAGYIAPTPAPTLAPQRIAHQGYITAKGLGLQPVQPNT